MSDLTYQKLWILLDLTDVEVDYLVAWLEDVGENLPAHGYTLGEQEAARAILRKLFAPA